jgi:hypothetical protein
MGSHDSFGHFKHKLWRKKGSWIKLAIWLPPTKSQKSPRFPCVQLACDILLKISRWGLQLCFKPHFNRRSAHKIMCPQSVGILTLRISKLPFRSPKTKWHLGASLMAMHKKYYKEEGDGFPQVRAVVSLVSPCLPMVRPCTKNTQITH